jgi:ComF family protein
MSQAKLNKKKFESGFAARCALNCYIDPMLKALMRATRPWPAVCQVCGQWPAQPVCEACVRRFVVARWRCQACAAPLTQDSGVCGDCLTRTKAAPLDRCLTAVDYAYPWDDLIARFKFRDEPGLAGALAERMLAAPGAAEAIAGADWLVPIPLNPQRLTSRGYNQAWELVKALRARLVPPPLAIADALVRLGAAPDQHSLPRAERLGNLRGAFAVAPRHVETLRGARVLLVDDVSTTGATLHNAALALRHGGVAWVQGLVIARTLSH